MNGSRKKRAGMISFGLLVVLVGVPALLTWRAVRQERLDKALIAAVKESNGLHVT